MSRFYNSKTLRQRVVAIVKGITADGLYDLDVKSRALPENVSRYASWSELSRLRFRFLISKRCVSASRCFSNNFESLT